MFRDVDVQYAMEMTRVLHEPARLIDTFASTRFDFQLLAEPLDAVNQTRVRDGRIEAGRPRIITPEMLRQMSFEGFGEQAESFSRWWRQHAPDHALLRYGFHFQKTDVSEHLVHEPLADVRARILGAARDGGNPALAVIEGVDDTWEISLLRFTIELIQKSGGSNLFDFKRRGLL
jgi:hypothetical protein